MKKLIISFLLIISILFQTFPLEVDVNEIKTGKEIKFTNFTGVQDRYSAQIIRGIGRYISREVKKGKARGIYHSRYSVVHAVDPSMQEGYDADIMSILKLAKVNHIDSLRLIIAGFLEEQYGYTPANAMTLAYFITVYNAVYRGNTGYFGEKYKPVVMKNLVKEITGLSTHFNDWSGGTQLVIPLTGEAGFKDLSSLDTSELSDDKVVETLRKEDDRGIEERKELVEIKEDEVIQDKEEVVEAKDEVVEEKNEIEEAKEEVEEAKEELAEEKEVLEEKKEEIVEKEDEIAKEKEEAEKIEDPDEKAEKLAEIAEKEEKLEEAKEEVKAEEEKIEEKEAAVESKEEEIAAKEEEVTEKEAAIETKEETIVEKEKEIEEEKKEIARDEKILEIKEDPETFAENLLEKEEELKIQEEELKSGQTDERIAGGKFYYLKMEKYMSGGHYNNSLYILNAADGSVLVKAPEANISGRKYFATTDGIVVVINKGVGSEHNYLALLDPDTLETKTVSEDAVFHRSFVEVRDQNIYVMTHISPNYYLGKYDMNMQRLALSSEAIDPDTFITVYGDRIYVNSVEKNILAVNKDDLSLIDTISPE